ncbi:MAG: V-type ATP synthase subunit B [Oscillospiraceae bacterium]|nr:V-type ATP synthase subunit B [Oscillospiraceae bacterium]
MNNIEYIGLSQINGPLVVLDGLDGGCYEELVEICCKDEKRLGRIIQIEGNRAIVQVFEGTSALSLTNTRTRLLGRPMELAVGRDMLGRIFDGVGRPKDGYGEIFAEARLDINGSPINPVSRDYPRDYIKTGISSIDGLATLIKGQKLPIFSGSGMSHNELAAQIVRQASVEGEDYAIIFVAMGVKNDVAQYFAQTFEETGALSRVAMFANLANDPIIERITAPRCALTAAEFLAVNHGLDVLVIMTDMTSYAEALREFSSAKGEIPGRKGYPGYLYSDLASLYERAGKLKNIKGSITQLPILTMPNDDITHPVPDLTGYITEGQIVLSRSLEQSGVYPPVSILLSLSRLMKDGIGEKYTRADHSALANQLFSSYAKVEEARSLASVIGEEDLAATDKLYIDFGRKFDSLFLNQSKSDNRTLEATLNLGWELLSCLPKEELDRVDPALLDQKYGKTKSSEAGGEK